MSLQQGDRIRTGPSSSAVIIFFEGSVTEVSADSEIRLDEMRREGGSTVVKIREEIGTTSSRVDKLIDARSRYEVETPAGSALVRGSVMGVIVLDNGTTIIDAIQGQCWALAQGVEVLIPEGMRSIIYRGSAPSGAASSSGSVNPPVISPAQSGQAPAFFNIEPYEDPGGGSGTGEADLIDILPPLCGSPKVVTVGYDEWSMPNETFMLTLLGELQNICPGVDAYVLFEWDFESGTYSHQSSSQLMTGNGAFSIDYDLYDLINTYWPDQPGSPVIYFRAKVTWGSDGVGYGLEKAYAVP
jgi:hypothetical protein